MPAGKAVEVWDSLISTAEVHPIGLGARDSLRLEAGLCLYGNDIVRHKSAYLASRYLFGRLMHMQSPHTLTSPFLSFPFLISQDATTSPVEAGLNFVIGKRRREEGGFLGEEVILDHLRNGITRRRMAFEVTKGAPARGGETIVHPETGEEIGIVTSGGFGPSVGKSVGMGYCNKPHNKTGTDIKFQVRTRMSEATVRKMPLVPSNYFRVE